MKYFLLAIISIFISVQLNAQFGGSSTYDFLNLTSSARVNALGGTQVGLIDSSELSLSYYNPAMLMPGMHNAITMNYIDYIADSKIGYASYANHIEGIGTFSAGVQYVNYGKFKEATEEGFLTGNTFTANDFALNLIYARKIWEGITGGVNIKPIYSHYDIYNSFGIAADLGVSYIDSSGNFTAGIVAKNMGMQLTNYVTNGGQREPLPFDLQAGFSQRLAHAPFRFNVSFHDLTRWDLTDLSTWNADNADEDEAVYGKSDDFIKQFIRHAILGIEFIPTSNFIIGVGYNFQRRYELGLKTNPGLVGLSGGFTVKVSKFRVSYAVASYHLAGTSNNFSISTNLSEFIR